MSKIEWTHRPGTKSEVLNPTTGCDKVSRGCRNCYAEIMHRRLGAMGQPKYQEPFLGHVNFWPDELAKPFRWTKPRTVFLNSMSDIFHKDVTLLQIAEIYAMMFLTPQHTYQVLTKRAERAHDILNSGAFMHALYLACNRLHDKYIKPLEQEMYQYVEIESMWPLKNVWQGISAEDQETYDERYTWLINTPAHIRMLSLEPLVGPIDMRLVDKWCTKEEIAHDCDHVYDKIQWVITGGESGNKAAPAHPDWFRSLRDQCSEAGVSFFFKQWGTWAPDVEIPDNAAMAHVWDNLPDPGYPVQIINSAGKHNRELLIKPITEPHIRMLKKGKYESGNLLDGVQHLNYPE